MLTGRRLVFVCGDARQLEVIAQVTELDASAALIGFDGIDRTYPDTIHTTLSEEVFADADAVVLPMAGTDEDGRVASQFTSEPLVLTPNYFDAMQPGTMVFTGIAGAYLKDACQQRDLVLVELMALDEVAILNSIPTAEGAIAVAMEHTDITIHGANVVVLGFGRCGHTLARTLKALGANVTVIARDPAMLARAIEMGVKAESMGGLEAAMQQADIAFNTIPYLVLTASVLRTTPVSCVIIDIASKPGGTDFRFAERRHMKAILTPSLPGIVAPKTAGRIIGNTVSRILAGGFATHVNH